MGPDLPCFIHIPKAGGNTVRAVLAASHGDGFGDVFVRERDDGHGPKTVRSDSADVTNAREECRRRTAELTCLAINLPYGVHEWFDRPVRYVTLLREPVERCISYWYFAYRMREHRSMWNTFVAYDLDVERIVSECVDPGLVNDQVRMITGSGATTMTNADLELAKESIERRYALVGTLEQLGAVRAELARYLRCHWPDEVHENVGDRSDASLLMANARDVLREANDLDARLYEWVVSSYLPRRLEHRGAPALAVPTS